jgi:hypothetical protein
MIAAAPPLAAAAERLRGKPGRPRKGPIGEQAVAAVSPRLMDLDGTSRYLAISSWSVRDLEAAGILRRVRVPLPGGAELRKLLFDRVDLDELIVRWKDGGPA